MYLIYYVKDGIKGWELNENKKSLEKWADKNLDTSKMFGNNEYEIVDLASTDLVRKTKELKAILNKIKDIVNS